MKRWIALAGVVLLGVTAIVVSERRRVDASASPAALLYLVADSERELTRMPVHFTRMSDAEEIRIGDELAGYYSPPEDEKKRPETIVVEKYLSEVGGRLASRAHRKLPYKFHYLPAPYLINAFALPGGHVYVGGGLLALMDSEDGLAAVLGHEIEHVDHYHCAERVQQEQALYKVPLGGLIAIPIEVFEAGYSKDQELEADREGTRLSVQAGYSANGAIRMFETFQRLFNEYQGRARNPEEELSDVAQQTLEGYFRSHPLPSERIARVQKMIASEGWTPRAERDLAVAYIFLAARAQAALSATKYQQAEQLASRSLRSNPDQEKALVVLARAQFAQAEFARAAASYRKLLERNSSNDSLAQAYAAALAATERKTAAAEFRKWLDSVVGKRPSDADVVLSGLMLLAGDPGPAHAIELRVKQSSDAERPVRLGELGWWHYQAGDYQPAADLLGQAVQERPGDARLWLEHTWSLIQIRRLSDAIQTTNTFYDEATKSERLMAQAVAYWQAKAPTAAMISFETATAAQPEWENPQWVKSLYSPLVAESVQEMQAEQKRQREARTASRR